MGAKENARKRFAEMNMDSSEMPDQPKRKRGPIAMPWRGVDMCRISPYFCNTVPDVQDNTPKPTPTPRGRR